MTYKRYIKKGGKVFGPYYYESYRDKNGITKTRYVSPKENKNLFSAVTKLNFSFFLILLFIFLLIGGFSYLKYHENHSQENSGEKAVFGVIRDSYRQIITTFTTSGAEENEENSEASDSEEESVDEENSEESAGEEIASEESSDEDEEGLEETPEVGEADVEQPLEEPPELIEEESAEEIFEENESEDFLNETNESDFELPELEIFDFNETNSSEFSFNETNETVYESVLTNQTGNETNRTLILQEFAIERQVNRARIVIGRPVKWIEVVSFVNESNSSEILIEIPKNSTNVTIKSGEEIEIALSEIEDYDSVIENGDRNEIVSGLTGFVSYDLAERENIFVKLRKIFSGIFITGKAISEEELEMEEKIIETVDEKFVDLSNVSDGEVAVEYYTSPPTAVESETKTGKLVTINGPEEIGYEDILAYTLIDEEYFVGEEDRIKVYWREESEFVEFEAFDLDENGFLDYIEWNVEHLSEQNFAIILITEAQHLDENKTFISDIYEEVYRLDGVWSEEIPEGHYVRVVFERNLTSSRDITIYSRIVSGAPRIEIYEMNGSEIIAEFNSLDDYEYNKVYLEGLEGEQDTFDLKILDGNVEFDHIIDPETSPPNVSFISPTPSNASIQTATAIYVNLSSADDNGDHYAFVDFRKDLLLWMRMDDVNSSGDPYDLSSYSKNATSQGNSVNVSGGKFGQAFNFGGSGSGDYLSLATSNDWPGTSRPFTISVWTNYTGSGSYQAVYSFGDYSPAAYLQDSGSNIELDWYNGAGDNILTLASNSQKNTWHHLVVTRNSTNDISVYWDNSYVGMVASGDTIDLSGKPLYIGFDNFAGDEFQGRLDEFLIFNRTLATNEIAALYNASATKYFRNYTGLVNGTYNFTGYAVDLAGKKNQTEQRSVTVNTSYSAGDTTAPIVTVNFPVAGTVYTAANLPLNFNISLNEAGSARYSLNNGANNFTMYNTSGGTIGTLLNATNSSIADGIYTIKFFANDTSGNNNWTTNVSFIFDYLIPQISFVSPTPANGSTQAATTIFVNVSSNDSNLHYTFVDFNRDLVLWWRMDDVNSSGSPTDLSSYSRNGTKNANANQTANGLFGKGFSLDGVGDFVYANSNPLPSLAVSNSLCTWINLTNTNIAESGYSPTIANVYLDNNNGLRLGVDETSKKIYMPYIAGGSQYGRLSALTILPANWYHVCYTFNTTTVRLYVNGTYSDSGSTTTAAYGISSTTTFTLGARSSTLGTINGTLEELIVFNRTLSDQEILALYNASANKYFRNFTELNNGTYNFTGYAVDSVGNRNQTERRMVTVNTSYSASDTTAPIVSVNFPTANAFYKTSNLPLNFNISLNENGGARYTLNNGVNNFTMHNTSGGLIGTLLNRTNGSIADGVYTIKFFANDTTGNQNNTVNRTFTFDSIVPSLNVSYPVATTYTSVPTSIIFDANDTNLQMCWFTTGTLSANVSLGDCSNDFLEENGEMNLTEGSNTLTVYANDSAGNVNITVITFTVDSVKPSVSLVFPANGTVTPTANNYFNASAYDTAGILSFNIVIWNSSGSVIYETFDLELSPETSVNRSLNYTFSSSGIYRWNFQAVDQSGNYAYNHTNFTINYTPDTIVPSINVVYPLNITYNSIVTALNYTVNDTHPQACWYSTNGGVTNTSVTCGTNVTGLTSSQGSNTWRIYANDTSGNQNHSSIPFFVDSIKPNVNFTGGTPSNGSVVEVNYFAVNVSSNDTNRHYTFVDLNRDLLLWMRMDEVNQTLEGARIYDNSSYKANGTAVGNAVQNNSGYFGKSFSFDGAGDGIDLDNLSISSTRSDTISVWIKVPALPGASIVNRTIFSSGFNGSNQGTYLIMYGNGIGTSFLQFGDAGGAATWTISGWSANEWHHVVGVTGNRHTLYTDGVSRATSAGLSGLKGGLGCYSIGARTNLTCGTRTFDNYFLGEIDEVMYFKRNLNIAEISALYNATASKYYNNFTSLSQGQYNFTGFAVDVSGNINQTERRTVIFDSLPVVTVNFPAQNAYYRAANLSLNFNISLNENGSARYTLNNGVNNFTMHNTSGGLIGTLLNRTNGSIADGVYTIKFFANDTTGNQNNTVNRTFTFDSIVPNLTVVYPQNTTYNVNYISFIQINVSDTNLDSCWFTNDSGITNTTMASGSGCNDAFDLLEPILLSQGYNTWTFYMSDLAGNVNATNVTFFVDSLGPGINFTNPTPVNGSTNATVQINISITEENLAELKFNWNGTNFTVYNGSIILMYNFENNSAIGENASLVVDNPGKYNGTIGAATLVNGKYGKGYWFNDSNHYINTSFGNGLSLQSTTTFMGWVYKNDSCTSDDDHLLGTKNPTTQRIYIRCTLGNWTIRLGSANANTSAKEMTLNTWQHFAYVLNGVSSTLYVDGVAVATLATPAASLSTNIAIGNIAFNDAGTQAEGFGGIIDEFQIWNRSLTAAEINQMRMMNLYKYNSTQWYLGVNQTLNSSTQLSAGTYTYFASAKDHFGNENSTETRSVSTSPSIAISLSSRLQQPINWTVVQIPAFNLSADGNNGTGQTLFFVNISSDGGTADVYMKGSDLRTSGGDILAVGNETYSYNMTNSSVPSISKFRLTSNFSDNKIGSSLSTGQAIYLKFFLNVPAGQPVGTYNNSLEFKAVPTGESP